MTSPLWIEIRAVRKCRVDLLTNTYAERMLFCRLHAVKTMLYFSSRIDLHVFACMRSSALSKVQVCNVQSVNWNSADARAFTKELMQIDVFNCKMSLFRMHVRAHFFMRPAYYFSKCSQTQTARFNVPV